MGFLNLFKRRQQQVDTPTVVTPQKKEMNQEQLLTYYKDIELHIGKAGTQTEAAIKDLPRAGSTTLTYQKPQVVRRDDRKDRVLIFEPCIYSLQELAVARDSESLINSSAEKHVEIALKAGFSIDGPKRLTEHVRDRIFEIEINSQITMFDVVESLLDQVNLYGTGFLVVSRDKGRASGREFRMFGKKLDPIAAWSVPDTPTMSLAENASGKIIKWRQSIGESGYIRAVGPKDREYDYHDVFVFTRHRQAGRQFGRSMYLPTLDDALMLRALEDLVNVISQKYAFPMSHHIIGNKDNPAGDVVVDGVRVSEVELAKNALAAMNPEDIMVTSERHEIKMVGVEGKVLDLSKYIEHFKARVQESTRMSNTMLGTGGGETKSVGQAQMDNLNDSVKYLQQRISDGFYWFFINLLADGGIDINKDNMVVLDFTNANSEETRAQENHILAQYQGDLINEDEARKELGKPPMTEEQRKKTMSARSMESDVKLAKVKAAAKPKPAGSKVKKKKKASKNSTKSKTRPTNQSGTKSTKTKVVKNDSVDAAMEILDTLRLDILSTETPETFEINDYVDKMVLATKPYIDIEILNGAIEAKKEITNAILSSDCYTQTYNAISVYLKENFFDELFAKTQLEANAYLELNRDKIRTILNNLDEFCREFSYYNVITNNNGKDSEFENIIRDSCYPLLTKEPDECQDL